jgi:hypothetical protein
MGVGWPRLLRLIERASSTTTLDNNVKCVGGVWNAPNVNDTATREAINGPSDYRRSSCPV